MQRLNRLQYRREAILGGESKRLTAVLARKFMLFISRRFACRSCESAADPVTRTLQSTYSYDEAATIFRLAFEFSDFPLVQSLVLLHFT